MLLDGTSVTAAAARGQQRATRIVFFITGLGMAAWAPLGPFAKARVGINEGVLGRCCCVLALGLEW